MYLIENKKWYAYIELNIKKYILIMVEDHSRFLELNDEGIRIILFL